MTTPNAARKVIYSEFINNWAPSTPTVPFAFENEDFDTEGKDEYVSLIIQHSPAGGQITLGPVGGRIFRRRAVLRIQIYTTVDRGLLRLDELAKAARDLFEAKTISLVMFHDSAFIENGIVDGKLKGTVNIFFTYDETK